MAKSFSFGKVDVGLFASTEQARGTPDPETPFRILLLGDFSGRASRGVCQPQDLAARKTVAVDRDNYDRTIQRLDVEVRLPVNDDAGKPITMRFAERDDFDPDRIFEQLALFGKLRELRQNLFDPDHFDRAKAEVLSWSGKTGDKKPAKAEKPAARPEPIEPPEDLLATMLDQAEEELTPETLPRRASQWQEMIADIVRPYAVPKADPQQAELFALVDNAIGELMRKLLHQPAFQAIEAAWRGVYFLISRLETGAELKLFLLDVSKAELAADVGAAEDLEASQLYKVLVERTVQTPGAQPWAVVAGNYTFGPTAGDAQLLGRIARLARLAGAPFLAAASPRLAGCESLARKPDPREWNFVAAGEDLAAWKALRGLPEASYVGLAMPRFLLRLPYSGETIGTERFDFNEMPGEPQHQNYLWGNPALACVGLLGETFTRRGWQLRPGMVQDIGDLPAHVYQSEGESVVKPCAEVLLTERAIDRILAAGLMPLVSFQNQDTVRLTAFQSITDPPKPLGGPWG